VGPTLANKEKAEQAACRSFGMNLGIAFQLIDDALDYSSSAEELGKNIGDDLAEGKPTLPLLYTMHNGNEAQRALIRSVIEEGGKDRINEVIAAIESTGAIAYTSRSAQIEADKAIAQLANIPDSPYKEALVALARFAVSRSH
jgi:octaprenyl-diphosphate synthase